MIKSYPFYLKYACIIVSTYLTFYILYIGQSIFFPLLFAFFISILLNPLVNKFTSFKIPQVLSIVIALLLAVAVCLGIGLYFGMQISQFKEDIPHLEQNMNIFLTDLQNWITLNFRYTHDEQLKYIDGLRNDALKNIGGFAGNTLLSFSHTLISVVMVPIYTFLILNYKKNLTRFIFRIMSKEYHENARDIISSTKKVVQSYLVGLMIEMVVVAVLNSIGLMIFGIKYAVLLGVLFAVLNIIPYVGALSGMIIAVSITFMNSGDLSSTLQVLAVLGIIHLLDANILMPKIVGSKVQINVLVTLVVIFIGGTLFGIPGMFLSLPTVAICKVIFDRVDNMKPWGLLLGDD